MCVECTSIYLVLCSCWWHVKCVLCVIKCVECVVLLCSVVLCSDGVMVPGNYRPCCRVYRLPRAAATAAAGLAQLEQLAAQLTAAAILHADPGQS